MESRRFSTLYERGWRSMGSLQLEESEIVEFVGELDDGSLAIARRASAFTEAELTRARSRWPYAAPPTTFDWTVEALVPSEPLRLRPIASDLRRSGVNRLFFSRAGRLQLVTAQGMVDVADGVFSVEPATQR
jgi:hypothetical protein